MQKNQKTSNKKKNKSINKIIIIKENSINLFQKPPNTIKMKIIIRACQIYGGNMYSVDVEDFDPISAVKRKISDNTGK
jgi:hypothetical protein